MAATSGPPPQTGQTQGVGGTGPDELTTTDEVKEYCHEGDGEKTEHLNSMDLTDIKSELEKDAEEAETPKGNTTSSTSGYTGSTNTSVNSQTIQFRPTVVQPMVYAANGFMVPQFAHGTSLYPVTAAGLRQVKMDMPSTSTTDWSKPGQSISIPYGYPTSFVSSIPIDQSLRSYPFLMSGQYVTQIPYTTQHQLAASNYGSTIAPNAAVHPHSGMIAPQQKEKKPHIKKPLNAFMLFMKEKRAEVIKECTLKESAAINQILGKMWHKLDKSEQAKYYEMAREERTKHMQMYPGWSARDNYAVHKKRKKKKPRAMESENAADGDGTDSECATDNGRKCRARYGMEQQDMWCEPCRKKKRCIRSEDSDIDTIKTLPHVVTKLTGAQISATIPSSTNYQSSSSTCITSVKTELLNIT